MAGCKCHCENSQLSLSDCRPPSSPVPALTGQLRGCSGRSAVCGHRKGLMEWLGHESLERAGPEFHSAPDPTLLSPLLDPITGRDHWLHNGHSVASSSVSLWVTDWKKNESSSVQGTGTAGEPQEKWSFCVTRVDCFFFDVFNPLFRLECWKWQSPV